MELYYNKTVSGYISKKNVLVADPLWTRVFKTYANQSGY